MTLPEARQTFLTRYDDLAIEMTDLFVQELIDQGHRATGRLIASVVVKVSVVMNEVELAMSHLQYGVIVNTGLSAAQVPRTIKFIQDLMAWIRIKRIAGGLDKTVQNIAVRMAKTMWKTGIPTPGSYRFTRNGRRTMWIDYVYGKYNVSWQDRIAVISGDYMEDAFDAIMERTAKAAAPYIEFSKN